MGTNNKKVLNKAETTVNTKEGKIVKNKEGHLRANGTTIYTDPVKKLKTVNPKTIEDATKYYDILQYLRTGYYSLPECCNYLGWTVDYFHHFKNNKHADRDQFRDDYNEALILHNNNRSIKLLQVAQEGLMKCLQGHEVTETATKFDMVEGEEIATSKIVTKKYIKPDYAAVLKVLEKLTPVFSEKVNIVQLQKIFLEFLEIITNSDQELAANILPYIENYIKMYESK